MLKILDNLKHIPGSMKTLVKLCEGSEKYATESGATEVGAEHYLLAAIDLPDGSARRVFERLDVDPDKLLGAINQQYSDALAKLGFDPSGIGSVIDDPEPVKKTLFFPSSASAKDVMQRLEAKCKEHLPLRGVHVIKVIAETEYGVVIRALRVLGIEPDMLSEAVKHELAG